jgi:hypothetical protein
MIRRGWRKGRVLCVKIRDGEGRGIYIGWLEGGDEMK